VGVELTSAAGAPTMRATWRRSAPRPRPCFWL